MTFGDGVLKIYRESNIAENGAKPIKGLTLLGAHYFEYTFLGINRYYMALQAMQQISTVVVIPDWHDLLATDIVVTEDGTQYRIAQIQLERQNDGLKNTRLTLSRMEENYELPPET